MRSAHDLTVGDDTIFDGIKVVGAALRSKAPDTDIFWATATGHREDVARLLRENPALANAKDLSGRTPLRLAIQRGHKDLAGLLLACGADINDRNDWGETPLHWVARRGQASAVKLLLEYGADAQARDLWKKTPLERALQSGYNDIAEMLR